MSTLQFPLPPLDREPSWVEVPNLRRQSLQYASKGLVIAHQLLDLNNASFICFHVDMTSKPRRFGATYWFHEGEQVRADIAQGSAWPLLAELYGCIADLMRDLHARWPANAAPIRLGVAMDRETMVFNSHHPSAEGNKWLLEHRSGEAPASLLIGSKVGAGLPSIMVKSRKAHA